MKQASVALAIADTESYLLANNAIDACLSRFGFSSVYVFTDRIDLWPQHNSVAIAKIQGIDDYNRIVLEELPKYVEEEFCIVAQYDGFIINRAAFSNRFFDFDYIGAVWHGFPYCRVGNGGFSWRSRKLMQAASRIAHLRAPREPEDVFICRAMRVMLEERFGCWFADEDTAEQFSVEYAYGHTQPFGFHGLLNLPIIYRDSLKLMVENLPHRILVNRLEWLRQGVRHLDTERQLEFEKAVEAVLSRGW